MIPSSFCILARGMCVTSHSEYAQNSAEFQWVPFPIGPGTEEQAECFRAEVCWCRAEDDLKYQMGQKLKF